MYPIHTTFTASLRTIDIDNPAVVILRSREPSPKITNRNDDVVLKSEWRVIKTLLVKLTARGRVSLTNRTMPLHKLEDVRKPSEILHVTPKLHCKYLNHNCPLKSLGR